jgi:non-specific protein-tyrosine kinase
MNMASRQSILRGATEALGLSSVPEERNVSAHIVLNTQFLEISVRDGDPERARTIADAIAQQLILQSPEGHAEEQAQRAFVQTQMQDLQRDIQATREEMAAEREKLTATDGAQASQRHQDNIANLQQRLDSYRSTYAGLLQIVGHRTNDITVFEPATTSSKPVSPRLPKVVLVTTAVGLLLALGVVYLIEFLDDTVKTTDELARATKLPALGTVSRRKSKERDENLVTLQSRSRTAEDYRTLRTNIQFSSMYRPMRTVMVTSPGHLEGKTTTAMNLSIVVAQTGKSVVLVDADLRQPRLHHVFRLPGNSGLTSALTADEPGLDGWLQQTGIDNLRVLVSGPLPPNPSELLGSQKMEYLIKQLEEEADLVVFDTPPVLAVTDAAVLASQTDGVLLITEAGKTRRAAVVRAMENLQQVGANVVGGVLNKFSPRSSEDYYYGKP